MSSKLIDKSGYTYNSETSGKPHTSKTSSNVNARSSLYSYSYAGHAPTQSYAYREEASSMFARSSNFEDAYSGSRFKYGDKPSGNLPARDSIEPSQHVINDLKEELRVNVDDDLKRNMPFFRRKFNEQRRQLQHLENTVIRHGDRVMKAVREGFQGPHERIGDLVCLSKLHFWFTMSTNEITGAARDMEGNGKVAIFPY